MNKTHKLMDISIHTMIFAFFLIPLAIPYSYFPLSKFYSEVVVLGLALILGMLMIFRGKSIAISSVGVASILFSLFLILQIFFIHIRFPGINLAIACEFIIATILSIGVVSYIDGLENIHKKLTLIVMWAVLIGTTLQAFYGLLQFTGAASHFPNFILYTKSGWDGILGNVGQKNDYADFVFLGVFALAYLYFMREVNVWVFSLYEIFFLTILTMCTSRSALLYPVVAFFASLLYLKSQKNNPDKKQEAKRILSLISILMVGFLALQVFLPLLWNHFTAPAATSVDTSSNAPTSFTVPKGEITSGIYRFKARDLVSQTTNRRVYEWYKDIIIFVHHPILGIGWYQYPREAIYLMETPRFMSITPNTALYTHSHNSPLNILAETGIIGFFITMIFGFAYSLYRMFKKFNNPETLFFSFLILTTFMQSLFQYPLWYAYFLMYFIFFLSFDKPMYSLKNNKVIKISILCIVLALGYMLQTGASTYTELVGYTAVPQDSDDFTANVSNLRNIVDNNLLWSFPALMVLDNYIIPGLPQTNAAMLVSDQMKYTDMLASELPYSGAIFKQVVLHKLNGDDQGSIRYANLLAHAFPAWKDKMADELAASPNFAAEVKVLRGFNFQENTIFKKLFGNGGQE